jgi:hypothetical protein
MRPTARQLVRLVRRRPLLAAAAAAALAASAAVPAFASPGAPVGHGSPLSAVDRVDDFYGAYIDARYDGHGDLAGRLRRDFLTGDLRKRLAAWEARNHADGVLHAQDVPDAWSVTYAGSGAGHAFTTVTFTWGTGRHATHTHVEIASQLSTRLISDIR